ncbi:signal-induced proliferation-associated 1-like protein 1 isoform X1 [Schistocerca gregaria]|uniref:signal-induced proliferation-associated 1-like protein 1 isoform X1 n=1 Tax=Schistocerca gregaria TaxID=7010 RepID=UPI00211E8E36|nr:signal-induced proliferation-associated 1-like protein 1 isoform X1 [Schistocerca gregaria]
MTLLQRSSSSLELSQQEHGPAPALGLCPPAPATPGGGHGLGAGAAAHALPLRTAGRQYGSHGSIDVVANGCAGGGGESFFALVEEFRPVLDQRSPGPAEYLRGRVEPPPQRDNAANAFVDERPSAPAASAAAAAASPGAASERSPRARLKLHRFWSATNGAKSTPSRQISTPDDSGCPTPDSAEQQQGRCRWRQLQFAHHDLQSLTAGSLGCAALRLRGLQLARRRNTATGASAASGAAAGGGGGAAAARAATPESPADSGPDAAPEEHDPGDGRCNDLLESCPFFRNEVGGEAERVVSLTRGGGGGGGGRAPPLHRPPLAAGVSVLEFPAGESHWRSGACPLRRQRAAIEGVDRGALYYRNYFHNQEHQNWFGVDENLGPIAVSLRRERLERGEASPTYLYRLLIRTTELLTLRGSVLEDAIPNIKPSNSNKGMCTKEVLEYIAPEIQLSCLRLGIASPQTEAQLLKLDEQALIRHYKVGVLYCRAGQSSEEDMYNNEDAGPALVEFLDTVGQRVRLRGFDKYRAGLDNKTDSTGLYSVYAQYQDCEIMFHVSTLLPFTPNNRQQLLRKRHIGNDIVTIVFQEPGAHPFTPKNIRSQFQHVFIVVRVVNPCTENTQYRVAVSRSKEVPPFGPPIQDGATFPKSKAFGDFLLAKVINAENAAHRSEKFATMATRTRQEYLKDLASNYTTTTVVESGQKFSMLSFGSKKKERASGNNPGGCPMASLSAWQRGAVAWPVLLEDGGGQQVSAGVTVVPCSLGVSADTLLLVDEQSRDVVFVTPCKAILGWQLSSNNVRLYHHTGECVSLQMRGETEDVTDLSARLRAVTPGAEARELTLHRNALGQLGFHVQPDGVVTQVEAAGLAWQAGLRQGARLVEICKVAVSTLSHDQMVDLLKTSVTVTVTVIPPLPDGTPRRGCSLPNCRASAGGNGAVGSGGAEGDYENVPCPGTGKPAVPGNHRRRYDQQEPERSFSPPRSSASSGYGTGSSGRSFGDPSRFPSNPEGTLTSSSSGHSGDDRWYEVPEPENVGTPLLDAQVPNGGNSPPPPPLPARLGSGGNSAFQQVKQRGNHSHSHSHSHSHAPFSLPHTLDCLTVRSPQKVEVMTCSLPPALPLLTGVPSDGHSTDTSSAASERLFGAPSEDDLSGGGSDGVSPRLRRTPRRQQQSQQTNASSGSSRNLSPRPANATGNHPGPGEARLRPGVTPRSRTDREHRASSGLTSSSLQEELMRLINPDYEDNPEKEKLCVNKAEPECERERERDRDHSRDREREREVILTTARPATVISNASTASSPAPTDNKIIPRDRDDSIPAYRRQITVGGTVGTGSGSKTEPLSLPLPDARQMDWPSLVDTATRAMLHLPPSEGGVGVGVGAGAELQAARNGESLGHWVDDVAERLGLDSVRTGSTGRQGRSVQQDHRRRLSLEDEVRRLRDENRRLRDENRRLQEESHAAAQQLRRFTEWFFHTLERQ